MTLALLLAIGLSAPGAEASGPEKERLTKPILAPGQTGREIESLILSKIPQLEIPDSPEEWRARSEKMRARVLDRVVFRGWPRDVAKGTAGIKYREEGTSLAGKGYRIRKLLYEPLPGLSIPALLYEPEGLEKAAGKVPAILNVNGHVGPPGKSIDYKQARCINLARRGMIALNPEWFAFGELAGDGYRHNQIAALDLCGRSGVALFYLALRGGLDVLLAHPATDPERIAVTGLSGGGWQTIFISSLDERVKACAPNAGYIGLATRVLHDGDVGDLEQNPVDLLLEADYTHLTALLVPRPAILIYNFKDDCCFASPRARESVYLPIVPFYRRFAPWAEFSFHENFEPGNHNYGLDNRQVFYRFINRIWVPPRERVDDELPTSDEIRSFDDLKVGLPEMNETFQSLALGLAAELPTYRAETLRADPALRREVRRQLRALLRMEREDVKAADSEAIPSGKRWRLRLTSGLTVPVLDLGAEAGSEETVILLSDGGRGASEARIKELLTQRKRVLAADILFTGECRPPRLSPSQFTMLLSNVGFRPLGEEAAQVLALGRWARQGSKKVTVEGRGRIVSTAILIAKALSTESGGPPLFDGVTEEGAPGSLKDLIRDWVSYDDAPQLFAFGFLELVDMPEIRALGEAKP